MFAEVPHRVSRAAAFFAAALVLGLPKAAGAHDPGLSVLEVRVAANRIFASLSLAAPDARIAASQSGGRLDTFALSAIELLIDDVTLSGAVDSQIVDSTSGTNVTLTFNRAAGLRLTVRSAVARRLARGHRELLVVRIASDQPSAEQMLDASSSAVTLDLGLERSRAEAGTRFLPLGIRYILGSYQHLMFLGALLVAVPSFGSMVKTVTAFTVAHSLTLTLAALGYVEAPAAVVEPLIAGSIVFVGIENLARGQVDSRWGLTFLFGLVHGFGFAGALRNLGVGSHGSSIGAPLGWFNAGVEIGQLCVVMLVWPLMSELNGHPALRVRLAPMCSLLVAAVALWDLIA